jgi:biopolymer transport protein ExbD
MQLKRRHKFTAEVATSSLNDIMFFLLLFFLIIATVANPNVIKILLPKATTAQAFSKKQVSLTVTADKNYFIDNKQVPSEQLETELLASLKGIDDPTVVLRIDQTLNVQDLVSVMEIGSRLKIKMVLATKSGT